MAKLTLVKEKSDLPEDTAIHVLHYSDHGMIGKDAIKNKRVERGSWMFQLLARRRGWLSNQPYDNLVGRSENGFVYTSCNRKASKQEGTRKRCLLTTSKQREDSSFFLSGSAYAV